MTIIANEVAYAGMGMNIDVHGLADLIKTDDTLNKIRENVMRLHDSQINISAHINGADRIAGLHKNLADINHSITSNIDVHASGLNTLNEIHRAVSQTKQSIDSLKRSMSMSLRMNMGSGMGALNHQVHSVNDSLRSLRHSGNSSLNSIARDSNSAKTKVHGLAETGMKIHGIFAGTFLGSAAQQAFSSIKSGAESAIKTGIKLVETGNQVKTAWQHIGIGNKNANDMVEQMDQLRDSAGMDETAIQRMQRSMYSLTGSAPRARSLTNEMVAFGKASGDSSQQIGRMGRTLPRLLSSSKVRATMFNRTLGQSPALVNAIAKASGHSKKAFQQLLQSGKLTSQQLQQYMMKASKGSSHAMDEYYSTLQGQIQAFKGMWTSAKENFSKPFVSNLSRAIAQTTHSAGGLRKVQTTVSKLSTTLGKQVGNYAGKAIGWIVKNQKPLFRTGEALFRILKAVGSGVWKTFSSLLTGITGGTQRSSKGFDNFSKALDRVSRHTKALQKFGRVLANLWLVGKLNHYLGKLSKVFPSLQRTNLRTLQASKFQKALNSSWATSSHRLVQLKDFTNRLRSSIGTLRHPILQARISSHNLGLTMHRAWSRAVSSIKSFGHQLTWANIKQKLAKIGTISLRGGITGLSMATKGFGYALDSIPIVGWIQLAIDGITEIYAHSAKFRRLVNPMLRFIGHSIGAIGNGIADCVEWVIKWSKKLGGLIGKVTGLFHHTKSSAHDTSSSMNRYTRNSETVYASAQRSNARNTRNVHKSIDRYRNNSAHKFRAYISQNGRIYKNYHKGTTRISETTYRQREALRSRYYRRYVASLKKYEHNYRSYENKRSSLSRKYGKLRAMYSVKSLRLIENRFKHLRNTVVQYARRMFHDTQRIFRKLGVGAGRQFRNIYRDVHKYMGMSNREAVKQFKQLYKNSRRWLNGSVNKYVRELRYRYQKQRYYDSQLVKQSKQTGKAMYKLPLGWIGRETKDLVRNWRRQRSSFITHNRRMTKSEHTHLHTMTTHLKSFRDNFEELMDHMEGNIYNHWSKFWSKMHNRAGSGMNEVQRPLNTGAMHINSFVRAFGETTSPMHSMPEVAYATGTGFRRPITQMVNATLNDGHDSPETDNQETVIHPNGQIEFPKGTNVKEMLEPGTEVLNATETKLMGEMAHFAPTVHLATGTGAFGNVFSSMSNWIHSALDGSNNGMDYSSIYNQAKGSGDHKLLHILQKVLSHSEQVLAGFMGNAPSGYSGALGNITKGAYAQTSSQIDAWWKALMNLTNQTLNQSDSDSPMLNFAEKFGQGKHYVYGATGAGGAYDCSGFVQAVLRHYGVSAPRTSGAQINSFPHISRGQAHAGDLVGNGGHIGIVADNGARHYYSAFSPSEGIRMFPLTSTYWNGGPMTFARVPKISQLSNNKGPSFKGASKGLMAFVKRQEAPMLKWIDKHLTPLLDANPGGYGVARWRPYIEKAASAMHVHLTSSGINKILSNIRHESNGNPTVQNNWDSNAKAGDPSIGLVQFIKSTFDHYAVHGHDNIRSGYDQLLALFNDSSWYSDIAPGGGWGPSGSRRYAKGGRFHAGELMTVGERGEELIKPDFSGKVIPHNDTKRIMNNNSKNSQPIKVNQNINVNVKDGSSSSQKTLINTLNKSGDELADKLADLFGFNNGGRVI